MMTPRSHLTRTMSHLPYLLTSCRTHLKTMVAEGCNVLMMLMLGSSRIVGTSDGKTMGGSNDLTSDSAAYV
jgi:hypothetical protein